MALLPFIQVSIRFFLQTSPKIFPLPGTIVCRIILAWAKFLFIPHFESAIGGFHQLQQCFLLSKHSFQIDLGPNWLFLDHFSSGYLQNYVLHFLLVFCFQVYGQVLFISLSLFLISYRSFYLHVLQPLFRDLLFLRSFQEHFRLTFWLQVHFVWDSFDGKT